MDGLTCWEQLGIVISWEWQDPLLLAVHFLTVSSFNLQHPAQFTPQVLEGLRLQFIEHLDRGVAVPEIRRRIARLAEGSTRILRPQDERRPVLRRWSITIADVYHGGQPQGAAERVKAWAAGIRQELDMQ
jgi:hypothetical protein